MICIQITLDKRVKTTGNFNKNAFSSLNNKCIHLENRNIIQIKLVEKDKRASMLPAYKDQHIKSVMDRKMYGQTDEEEVIPIKETRIDVIPQKV